MSISSASLTSARVALSMLSRDTGDAPALQVTEASKSAASPALVIDARTAKLADLAQQAQADAPSSISTADQNASTKRSSGSLEAGDLAFLDSAASSEQSALDMEKTYSTAKERIRLYDETGDLYSNDENGKLHVHPSTLNLSKSQKDEIMQGTRDRLGLYPDATAELKQHAKEMREFAEARVAAKLQGTWN